MAHHALQSLQHWDELQGCPMQLVAAVVPQVEGAPCLGGHNRADIPQDLATPEAAAAYLETLSTQSETRRSVTAF